MIEVITSACTIACGMLAAFGIAPSCETSECWTVSPAIVSSSSPKIRSPASPGGKSKRSMFTRFRSESVTAFLSEFAMKKTMCC